MRGSFRRERKTASASAKSSGWVILKFSDEPSTSRGDWPCHSIALASSVAFAPAPSSASASGPMRNICGVCACQMPSRGSVAITRPSRLALERVGHRQREQAADRVVGADVDQPVDPLRAHQAARGVVHQHPVVGAGAELAAGARVPRPPSRRASGRRSARPRSACPWEGRPGARTPRRRARARPGPARAGPRRRAPRGCAQPSARRRSRRTASAPALRRECPCRHRARGQSNGGRAERKSASAFGQAGPASISGARSVKSRPFSHAPRRRLHAAP